MNSHEDWVVEMLAPGALRHLSHHELKSVRCRMRREGEAIRAETIASGPDPNLCRRMNELEFLDRLVTRAERGAPRGGGMRQILTAIRRGAPQP